MSQQRYTNGVDQTAHQTVKPQQTPRYTSYEDIYRAIAPQNNDYEATAAQERYEDRHRALYAVTDAVAALGNLAGTAAYASPQQLPSLSAANNQRLDRLRQLRQAARDKYNAGLLDAAYRDRQDALQRSRYTEQTAREDKRYAEQQVREDKRYADQQARLAQQDEESRRRYEAEQAWRRKTYADQQARLAQQEELARRTEYRDRNGIAAIWQGDNVYLSKRDLAGAYDAIKRDIETELRDVISAEKAGKSKKELREGGRSESEKIYSEFVAALSQAKDQQARLSVLANYLTSYPQLLPRTTSNWTPKLTQAYDDGWRSYQSGGSEPMTPAQTEEQTPAESEPANTSWLFIQQ